ncbi:ABC transporter ATP-binding protein/permease [Nocardia bovistercoris]|uniref:ATP-binding cassette domain-containing protein n=1 Tax=Nocardia bovistercoris TaxID=2785916 RepID=A0A931IHR4_9NOCA|nr:ATP-binding cassette domain-containing protein [Nocardia bovistercoris]MBH0780601.1 ATP-binding cassette domain-containing protein [Nocardia bovistercoris]
MARPPLDPRLWKYARAARRYLVLSVGLSAVITVCIVVTAVVLARVLAGVVTDPERRSVGAWTVEITVLAVAIAVRVLATGFQSRLAHRAGADVVTELETAVLVAGARLPPRELETRRTELAVVIGSGLSGLRAYLTGYLPALILACLVPPIVLVVIAAHDLVSAAIAVLTLPLIPIFMILIGLLTRGRAEETLTATTRLSDQLLDLFAGMPTLRALGREGGDRTMAPRVHALGDALRTRTMRALRIAFLSSMVLELLATLSVALIAVSIGLRLVYGGMGLYAGLVALILAPEVYLPLRTVGERFHAAQDGMAAADKAFAILDPVGDRAALVVQADDGSTSVGAETGRSSVRGVVADSGAASVGGGSSSGVVARAVSVDGDHVDIGAEAGKPSVSGGAAVMSERGGDRAVLGPDAAEPVIGRGAVETFAIAGPEAQDCPVDGRGAVVVIRDLSVDTRRGHAPAGLSALARPGAVTVLAGPNGSGKSTALQAILGLVAPDRGAVLVDGVDVRELDTEAWWARLAWLPQRPVLVPGTLRENLELFGAHTGARALDTACAETGFDAVLDELPDRWETVVGLGGHGLSLGQRQRLALARVLASARPTLLLDEPTAHLDADSEAEVLTALRDHAARGATVIVVGHRPTVLAAADHIVHVRASLGIEVGQ